tara:strand:- start:359 stop:745 length:387 start_codon:yes stop_codon:yes gene_type:complete
MKNTNPKQKGILSELIAIAHFVKNKNNMVFLPLMGLGFIDILVLNKKTGEISFYDVKFGSRRKTNWVSKSRVKARCLKGQLIYRGSKSIQSKLGVRIIYVDEKGKIIFSNETAKKKKKATKLFFSRIL